jgi:hypothetical protein
MVSRCGGGGDEGALSAAEEQPMWRGEQCSGHGNQKGKEKRKKRKKEGRVSK